MCIESGQNDHGDQTWAALHSKTGRVSCIGDWLSDATGFGFATRPWYV